MAGGQYDEGDHCFTFRDRLAFVNADEEQNLLAKWMKKLRAPLVLLDGRSPEATELANGAQQ